MKKCILLLSLIGYLNFCKAQAGKLDPAFGVSGITTDDLGSVAKFNRIGKQVLVQSDSALYFISEENKIMYVTKKHINGSPDLTYGNKGISTSVSMNVVQAALQTDGKIIVVGNYNISGQQYNSTHIVIARFNTNGSLDDTFNSNGISALNMGYNELLTSMAIQKDNKIVVAGYTYANDLAFYGYRFLLYRFNTDGTLDKTFSRNGILTGEYVNQYNALTIQEDGKILTAYSIFDTLSNSYKLTLHRYNFDGNVDTSFLAGKPPSTNVEFDSKYIAILKSGKIIVAGNSKNDFALASWNKDAVFESIQTIDFNGNNDFLTGFALETNEEIILSGSSQKNNTSTFAIAKFTSNLMPDKSFAVDGKLTTEFNTDKNFANGVAVQSNGKVLAVGYVVNGADSSTAIVRYNIDGMLDNTFAVSGKLIENICQGSTKYTCTAVQKDGKIITGGITKLNNNTAFVIVRHDTNGKLDETFGMGGVQINDFGSFNNMLNAIAIQSDGKIIAGGSSNDSFTIARYNINGSLDKTFGTNGVKKHHFSDANYVNSISIQPDGKILAGGAVLARFNMDGTLDLSLNQIGFLVSHFPYNSIFNCVSIGLQKNGEIILLNNYYNQTPAVIKYFKNGQLDSSFGENGQLPIYSMDNGDGKSLLLQDDEKIVVGGFLEEVYRNTNSSYIITRLNNNGKTDTSFNGGQVVRTNIALRDYGKVLRIQNDSKIILAGYSYTDEGRNVFSIARYNTDGSLDKTFNNNGKVTTAVSGANSRIESISIFGNYLYAAGYGEYPNKFGVLARYFLCTKEDILPMKLINFKAQIPNSKISLSWQVENQLNLKGSYIEKSIDSTHFTSIGYATGKGNGNLNSYLFDDEQPLQGENYYRLKLVKTDSSYTYSQIVNVNMSKETEMVTIYPNPSKNKLLITKNNRFEQATLLIFDNNGTKQGESKIMLNGSSSIDVHSLRNGMYNLQINTKNSTQIIKFIKE